MLPEADEEFTVIGERRQKCSGFMFDCASEIPSQRFMWDIYKAHRKGARLYLAGQYEEAYPYLLAAAQTGFKLSQVRLGALYRYGLGGVRRNDYVGLGWLGLAARGESDPETRILFKDAWSHVPEEVQPRVTALIDELEAQFGGEANRVTCDMTRKAGSYVKRLSCTFDDEYLYGEFDDLLEGLPQPTGNGG